MLPRWLWIVLGLAALAPVLLALATRWWVSLWRKRLRTPDGFDETFPLRTADGAEIFLGRLHPASPTSALPPVVLCHGLSMNRRAFAFDSEKSLARALALRDRDVWVLELRGSDALAGTTSARDATFDTYAREDIPAALRKVREVTGRAEVDWVGFSMGGMLAYAFLGALGGAGIRRLVTIGSPVRFEGVRVERVARQVSLLLLPFRRVTPVNFLLTLVAPLMGRWMPPWLGEGFRAEHYDDATLRRVMVTTMGDIPVGVARQFLGWIADGRWDSVDGTVDYRAGLAKVTVPTCVIAGDRDRLARPLAVRTAYELLGAEERDCVEVGPGSGAHAHYDHLDLILGARAHEEVFPHVYAWLDREGVTPARSAG
jgi:pimeloyl-ACP methyl ester carboxylesterase